MPEHLRRAARARHDQALERAEAALRRLSKSGEPITFAAVGRAASVSTDFLYNTPTLRSRITELRRQPSTAPPADMSGAQEGSSSTSAIRALSTQLKDQRRHYREELQRLEQALAAAHGENLQLRRKLADLDT